MTRQDYIDANKAALNGDMRCYRTGALTAAANLGFENIDISKCESVIAYRFGAIPENGISYNYRDNECERGLSVAWLKGHKKEAKNRNMAEFADREVVRVEGLLLPVTGSDGEPLILPYGIDNLD